MFAGDGGRLELVMGLNNLNVGPPENWFPTASFPMKCLWQCHMEVGLVMATDPRPTSGFLSVLFQFILKISSNFIRPYYDSILDFAKSKI
jgi:hypothetical protein